MGILRELFFYDNIGIWIKIPNVSIYTWLAKLARSICMLTYVS